MKNKKIWGFTLGEVLVTLTVISLVAVIVLPMLRTGVGTKVSEGQKNVFVNKFKKGLTLMQQNGGLAKGYDSTEEFIAEMQKYVAITSTCKAGKLSKCFTSKIKSGPKTVKYTVDNLSTSQDLGLEWKTPSSIVGVVFADKTNALITYNTNCLITNMLDTAGVDTTKCMAVIYDINGNENPNILGDDIFTINVNTNNNAEQPENPTDECYGDEYCYLNKCQSNHDYEACRQQNIDSDCNTCGNYEDQSSWACQNCFNYYYSPTYDDPYDDPLYPDYPTYYGEYELWVRCINDYDLSACRQQSYSNECASCGEGNCDDCTMCSNQELQYWCEQEYGLNNNPYWCDEYGYCVYY